MPLQHSIILYLVKFAVYRLYLTEFAVDGAVIFFTTGRRLVTGRRGWLLLLLLLVSFRPDFLHSLVQFLRSSLYGFDIAALQCLVYCGNLAFNLLV